MQGKAPKTVKIGAKNYPGFNKISRKNLQFLFYQKNEKKAQRYPFDEHKSRRAKSFDEKW